MNQHMNQMIATAPRKRLDAPDLLRKRMVLLTLTVLNIIVYMGLVITCLLFWIWFIPVLGQITESTTLYDKHVKDRSYMFLTQI